MLLPMTENWQQRAKRVAHGVRRRVLALTLQNNGCYLSQALSSADLLATLYTKSLRLGESVGNFMPTAHPGVPGRNGVKAGYGAAYNGTKQADKDRLLISPAHYAVAIYATLGGNGAPVC